MRYRQSSYVPRLNSEYARFHLTPVPLELMRLFPVREILLRVNLRVTDLI